MGASMRLGAYACELKEGTLAAAAYTAKDPSAVPLEEKGGKAVISERHRHRYEFNNDYQERFESAGFVFSGINPKKNLVEIAEIVGHPFMLGVQFHPEFQSRPLRPHPLFREFISACVK